MAAVQLQTVTEKLTEVARDGLETEMNDTYMSFLYEVRCLKANMAKYTDQPAAFDPVDTYSKLV